MRYLVASFLPPAIDTQIRQHYQNLIHQPLTIKHLHLSLVPPFFPLSPVTPPIKLLSPLQNIKIDHLPFSFSAPDFFSGENKQILYLPLTPTEPLTSLHHQLLTELSPLIKLDLEIYNHHLLPPFLPHLTLNYDFQGDQSQALNTLKPLTQIPAFHLQNPKLMTEATPHHWSVYQA